MTRARYSACFAVFFFFFIIEALAALEQNAVEEGKIRVQLVSKRQTTLSAEIAGRITQLPYREGDAFQNKAVLAAFDCALLKNQLEKAEAAHEAARRTLEVNKRLTELQSGSDLDVALAEAKVKETAAEVGAVKVTLGNCSITAPFSGRVAKLHVDPHQYVTPGAKLLDILDTGALEVKLVVPSRWLSWCKPGKPFTVSIEELNKTFRASVTRLGAKVDPLSQSIAITGEFTERHGELLPGMSGWASFPEK